MATGKFIAYYRVSTKRQADSGLGLEAQKAAVLAYLNGGDWELVAEYQDTESGTRKGNNRPELAKAINHAKRVGAKLLIAKLDRLARNVHFISGLMESRVDFEAVDNPKANRLTVHILAAVAEAEAEAISKRTKEALAAAKERGVQLGNPKNLPDDAHLKGGKVMRDRALTSYATIAQLVVTLKDVRGYSFRKITAHLNEVEGQTADGRSFNPMLVKRIYDRAKAQEGGL